MLELLKIERGYMKNKKKKQTLDQFMKELRKDSRKSITRNHLIKEKPNGTNNAKKA